MASASLFARVYLDENVHVLVAEILQAYGFDATTARDEGMLGENDPEHLSFAAAHGNVLVTHDRLDFEELARRYFEEGREHAGIIIAQDRPVRDLVQRLDMLLSKYTADELQNQLVYV